MPKLLSQIRLAHAYWEAHLDPGSVAIDATCGNGKDTLQLAHILAQKGGGAVIGLDVQHIAIARTQALLASHALPGVALHLFVSSHEQFPALCQTMPIQLIVYNLGYLPGADKSLTTRCESTLISLQAAMALLSMRGAISLTTYPGHPEGKREHEALLAHLSTLGPQWMVWHQQRMGRPNAPNLFLIQRNDYTLNRDPEGG